MKVVLLNPPGEKLYIRSYYCGSTSKSSYLFQPLDLLMLSGRFACEFEIMVVDAIADRLGSDDTLKKIFNFKAEAIVCVVSMVSWESDLKFLKQLKNDLPSLQIIANGDVFFDQAESLLAANQCIDAVIFDFASEDVIYYLKGEREKISNMLYKIEGRIAGQRNFPLAGAAFSLPVPRHELFLNSNYRFPFAKHYPFTTVLTNFGCPFKCQFCIANSLGFRYRPAEEVYDELLFIKELGIKEVFFEDMTFGIPKPNIIKLLNLMVNGKLDISWTCFSRADVVDEQMLLLMKKAGCHTIMMGVESANEDILQKYQKGCSKEMIKETFSIARILGLKTVGTFILGLPEDNRATVLETIRFAKDLDCDYASFNIAIPRPGTGLRKMAIDEGLISKDDLIFDHSGEKMFSLSRQLSVKELRWLQNKAIREFYLRPAYIIRQIMQIRSIIELREHILELFGLMQNVLKGHIE